MLIGTAVLDGQLRLALIDDDQFPAPGTQFDILTASSVVGEFSDVEFTGPDNIFLDGQVSYGNTFVRVQIDTATWRADFDRDVDLDGGDIDALVAAIAAMTHNPLFDLTADGLVNGDDLDTWLAQAGAVNLPAGSSYLYGDANLDGVVDGADFIIWNDNKFAVQAAWTAADFNADGVVDGADFIRWNDNKFMSSDMQSTAVPEPTVCWLLVSLGSAAALRCFRLSCHCLWCLSRRCQVVLGEEMDALREWAISATSIATY